LLAAQREAMGWTVEQIADQLKLAVRQVKALEAGDYDGAREGATALQERVRKLHLDKKRADALLSAIDELLAAIPS